MTNNKKKVFLGGTCNGSLWRDFVIPKLKIDYFNPVVDDWNSTAHQKELYEREHCDYCLYVITPRLNGFYSIAELIDDSNKRPQKTLFLFVESEGKQSFDQHQVETLNAISKMVQTNGAKYFESFQTLIKFLNGEES